MCVSRGLRRDVGLKVSGFKEEKGDHEPLSAVHLKDSF